MTPSCDWGSGAKTSPNLKQSPRGQKKMCSVCECVESAVVTHDQRFKLMQFYLKKSG